MTDNIVNVEELNKPEQMEVNSDYIPQDEQKKEESHHRQSPRARHHHHHHHHSKNNSEEHVATDDETPKEEVAAVGLFSLWRFASPLEIAMVILGSICAAAHGVLTPLMTIFLGDIINKFGPDTVRYSVTVILII